MIDTKRPSASRFKWALGGAACASALFALTMSGVFVPSASAQTAEQTRGKAVFDHWCAPCHAPGPGHPGTQGLEIKYRGTDTPAVLEERTDLTPPLVATFVRQGVLAMAPFRKTEITDADLAALSAYLDK